MKADQEKNSRDAQPKQRGIKHDIQTRRAVPHDADRLVKLVCSIARLRFILCFFHGGAPPSFRMAEKEPDEMADCEV